MAGQISTNFFKKSLDKFCISCYNENEEKRKFS